MLLPIELAGDVGTFLLASCSLPPAWVCYRDGNARSVSGALLWPWFMGELLMLYYVVHTYEFDWHLVGNYGVNVIGCSIIARYWCWPRDY